MLRDSHHLFDLFHEFDDAFRTFFNEPPVLSVRRLGPAGSAALQPSTGGEAWFQPAVEAFTRDGSLVVKAELPGVSPEEIEVIADGRTLTIRGEKKDQRETQEGRTFIREVRSGRFERSFTLPEDVAQSDIKANHTNGVLELTVPMKKAVEPKRIAIQSGERGAAKSGRNAA